MGIGYVHRFNAKDTEGECRELDVVPTKGPLTLGTWIKITASETFVNNVEAILLAKSQRKQNSQFRYSELII